MFAYRVFFFFGLMNSKILSKKNVIRKKKKKKRRKKKLSVFGLTEAQADVCGRHWLLSDSACQSNWNRLCHNGLCSRQMTAGTKSVKFRDCSWCPEVYKYISICTPNQTPAYTQASSHFDTLRVTVVFLVIWREYADKALAVNKLSLSLSFIFSPSW